LQHFGVSLEFFRVEDSQEAFPLSILQ
jgi:hypothetical protein